MIFIEQTHSASGILRLASGLSIRLMMILGSVVSLNSLVAQDIVINELMPSNSSTIIHSSGEYFDWVELRNNGTSTLSMEGMYLTDDITDLDKWAFPELELESGELAIVWLSALPDLTIGTDIHANFKLNSDGESVFLVSSSLSVLDAVTFGSMPPDISIGRSEPLIEDRVYFDTPTPLEPNSSSFFNGLAMAPEFSNSGGSNLNPFTLTHILNNPLDVIKYTLDFSDPTSSSELLPDFLPIEENTILRIKVFRDGAIPSEIATLSYLFDQELELPIMSLVSEDSVLFGSSGIYTNPHSGVEAPVHVSFYESDGTFGFSSNMGVKIHAPIIGTRNLYDCMPGQNMGRIE